MISYLHPISILKLVFTFLLQAHFSIKRAGVLLGIGLENVIEIGVDDRYVFILILLLNGIKYHVFFIFHKIVLKRVPLFKTEFPIQIQTK